MKYHETVPSEAGLYLLDDNELLWFSGSRWTDGNGEGRYDPKLYLPLLGPLPSTNDESIALACEVQFARMEASRHSLSVVIRNADDSLLYVNARARFLGNERSLSLYRDMEQVTRELTGEKT